MLQLLRYYFFAWLWLQLVVYPILNLRDYKQDVHWYLRALEETVIR
jgi:hypothetical protein